MSMAIGAYNTGIYVFDILMVTVGDSPIDVEDA